MAIIKKVFPGKEKEITAKAARIMKEGGVVIFPTESSYGIGVDATNETAIKKIAPIKGQPEEKNISIIVSSQAQAEQFGFVKEEAKKLVERFMPGPLTLIVKKKPGISNLLGTETIAFRISSNPIARSICTELGNGITATSANLHEMPNIYSGREVIKQFNNRVHMIIDDEELAHNTPSTIYNVQEKRILRTGPVTELRIKQALG